MSVLASLSDPLTVRYGLIAVMRHSSRAGGQPRGAPWRFRPLPASRRLRLLQCSIPESWRL